MPGVVVRPALAVRAAHGPTWYPGSPMIARTLLRPGDHLHLLELHPREHAALGEYPHARVHSPPMTAAVLATRLTLAGIASNRRLSSSSSAARLPVRLSPDEVTLGLGFGIGLVLELVDGLGSMSSTMPSREGRGLG